MELAKIKQEVLAECIFLTKEELLDEFSKRTIQAVKEIVESKKWKVLSNPDTNNVIDMILVDKANGHNQALDDIINSL